MTAGDILPRAFYDRPVLVVARELLGARLVRTDGRRGLVSGAIAEVEAYDGPDDLACHAARGRTRRTEPLFGSPGYAYIYLIYGMHWCLNVVTGPAGYPAAVLIRAVEPLEGLERMDPGRGRAPGAKIASGPGRLTRAFGIDRTLNLVDMTAPGPLFIAAGRRIGASRILRGERIGVEYAGDWARRPWRLGVRGSPTLSRPFPCVRAGGAAGKARARAPG